MVDKVEKVGRPKFGEMSNKELLAAYNELTGEDKKGGFIKNKEDGVAKCTEAFDAKVAADKKAAAKAKRDATKAEKGEGGEPSNRNRTNGYDKIKLLKDANPRRAGTDAHMHYEKMQDGNTVDEYLDQFEDRKLARAWLMNTVRDKHIEIVPGKAPVAKAA